MKRPDKYPAIDPRLPDLYGRILTAADAMRRARRLEDEVERMMTRVRLAAAATARAKLEEAEPVIVLVPALTPGSAVSGVVRPDPTVAVRVDAA